MSFADPIAVNLPSDTPELQRVLMTISCRDSESIPKVENAGACGELNGVTVQYMHNGLPVVKGGYYGEWMSEVIRCLKGHHEPQEERVFDEVLKHLPARATMIELGGFWAYYSLWFKKAAPSERVTYVIEPDPKHLDVGLRNFELNGWSGNFLSGFAGKHSEAEKPFVCESDQQTRLIDQIGIDDFMQARGIQYLDLLHCDAQGAEFSMLESAEKSIRGNRIRFLFLSTHHHTISGDPLTHQRCLEFIRRLGGHVLAEHTVAESFSGDGLIVASFLPSDRSIAKVPLSYNRASTSLYREVEYDLVDANQRSAELTARLANQPAIHENLFKGKLRTRARKVFSKLRKLKRRLAASADKPR